jgi:hypothetical protein
MMLTIEGIGGTGKAVVSLFRFVSELAAAIGITPPSADTHVIDQDRDGVWPGVPVTQPATVTGTLADALGLSDPQRRAASTAFFSDDELAIDLVRGFHGRPKLLAELQPTGIPGSRGEIHILIYSDIGGTGAGFGPVRLRQAVGTAGKRHVIAFVLGKYINRGTENPLGERLLRAFCDEQGTSGPYLTIFYVSAPPIQTTSGAPPASGLNPASVLASVAKAIWDIGLSLDRVDSHMQVAARSGGRGVFRTVDASAPMLSLTDTTHFVSRIAKASFDDDLSVLTLDRTYLFNTVQHIVTSDPLRRECWAVFHQPPSSAPVQPPQADLAGAFADYFAGGPDVMATALWFHRAVADGVPACRDAMRRLVHLYMLGRLFAVQLPWSGAPRDRIFLLSLTRLNARDPNIMQHVDGNVVGAFSLNWPFWTTPRFLATLNDATGPSEQLRIELWLKQGSQCDKCYTSVAPLSLGPDANVRSAITVDTRPSISPSQWDWTIGLQYSDWTHLREYVVALPVLTQRLSTQQLSWQYGVDHSFTVSASGLSIDDPILPDFDGIFIGSDKGIRLVELAINSKRERRLLSSTGAIVSEQAERSPAMLLGNILIQPGTNS